MSNTEKHLEDPAANADRAPGEQNENAKPAAKQQKTALDSQETQKPTTSSGLPGQEDVFQINENQSESETSLSDSQSPWSADRSGLARAASHSRGVQRKLLADNQEEDVSIFSSDSDTSVEVALQTFVYSALDEETSSADAVPPAPDATMGNPREAPSAATTDSPDITKPQTKDAAPASSSR